MAKEKKSHVCIFIVLTPVVVKSWSSCNNVCILKCVCTFTQSASHKLTCANKKDLENAYLSAWFWITKIVEMACVVSKWSYKFWLRAVKWIWMQSREYVIWWTSEAQKEPFLTLATDQSLKGVHRMVLLVDSMLCTQHVRGLREA